MVRLDKLSVIINVSTVGHYYNMDKKCIKRTVNFTIWFDMQQLCVGQL